MTTQAAIQFPRTVVFDWTTTGNGTATGEIKHNLFGSPSVNGCIFVSLDRHQLRVDDKTGTRHLKQEETAEIERIVDAFQPQLILYRPVADSDRFHQLAMNYIARRSDLPLAVWIMDDWLDRMRLSEPARYKQYDSDWRKLLDRSAARLSISEAMSAQFAKRYGTDFVAVANGVIPEQWPQPKKKPGKPFTVRYAGGLARDMTASSVYNVAQAIEDLADAGRPIVFEIHTRPWWHKAEGDRYARLKHTRFSTDDKSSQAYRDWLSGADAVLIAYNFDEESLRYTHASLANKLPECLACGAPLLAVGPRATATIKYLQDLKYELVLDDGYVKKIAATLAALMDDTARYAAIAENGQRLAFDKFNLATARTRLSQTLWQAAGKPAAIDSNAATAAQPTPKDTKALSRPGLRERALNYARRTNPILYRSLQFAGWGQRLVARHKALTLLAVLVLAALIWAIWYFPQPVVRFSALAALVAGALALFTVALVGFVGSRTRANLSEIRSLLESRSRSLLENQNRELQAARETVARLESRLASDTASRLAGVSTALRTEIAATRDEFQGSITALSTRAAADAAVQQQNTSEILLRLDDRLSLEVASRTGLTTELQHIASQLEKEVRALKGKLATTAPALQKKLNAALAGVDARLAGEAEANAQRMQTIVESIDSTAQELSDLSRRLESSEAELSTVRDSVLHGDDAVRREFETSLSSQLEPLSGAVAAANSSLSEIAQRIETELSALRDSELPALRDGVTGEIARQVTAELSTLRDSELPALKETVTGEVAERITAELSALRSAELPALKDAVTGEIARQVSTIEAKIDTQAAQAQSQTRHLGDELSRIDNVLKPASVLNLGLYQRFNRRLSEEQVANLTGKWGPALGMKVSRARLGYLAHRACFMENMMKGRLATTIETIVLRSLVCAAVPRQEVSILEIGTLFGVGAAAVYEAALNEHESVHLTVLDPLDGYYAAGHMDLLTGAEVSEKTLRQNFRFAPVPEEDYTVIRHLSTDDTAFKAASKRSYDALIIDGDHSYEGVKYDFDKYGPLVHEGGFILFDDYDVEDWPEIKRYVDTEIEGLPHLEKIGADYRTAVYRVKATQPAEAG